MTQVKTIQKFFAVLIMTTLLGQGMTSHAFAHSWNDDHGKSCHKKHKYHHEHDKPRYTSKNECRDIVQEFQISRYITYSESGLLCRNQAGGWQVVTPTQYPTLFGKVFFIEGGRKVLFGDVAPRQNGYSSHDRWGYEGMNDDRGWHDEPVYDYLDKKNHYFH